MTESNLQLVMETPTITASDVLEPREELPVAPVPSARADLTVSDGKRSLVDCIVDWLQFSARWYKTIIMLTILCLFILQYTLYSLQNTVAFLATSIILNCIVFLAGIGTTLALLYLTGYYFDVQRKPESYTEWPPQQFQPQTPSLDDPSESSNNDTSPSPTASSTSIQNDHFARRKTDTSRSSSRSIAEHKRDAYTKSTSAPAPTIRRTNTLSSIPFLSRARGLPPPVMSSVRGSTRRREEVPEESDLPEYGPDPRSLWLTHLIKHLFNEWKDSDKFLNGIRKKVESEISELLSKQTRFINRDISVNDIVKSIAIHQIEIGQAAPELTNFSHSYNDENRTCFELDFSYSDPDKKGTFYVEIEVDFVRLQRTMRFRLQLNYLEGRVKMCFERDPYSFWWFSFISDPKIDLQIRQYPLNDNNALVKWFRDEFLVNRIRTIIKKHHKLPNYKVRQRPLMPDTSVNSIANCKSNNMLLLGDVLPVYNIVEVSILEYARFPIQFDRISPEAGCFVRYTIELTSLEQEQSKSTQENFVMVDQEELIDVPLTAPSIMQRSPNELNVEHHQRDPRDSLEASPSRSSTPGIGSTESLTTLNMHPMEALPVDKADSVSQRSPKRTMQMLKKVTPNLRRRKGNNVKHNSVSTENEREFKKQFDTQSLNVEFEQLSSTALGTEALDQIEANREGSRTNQFGHAAGRVQDGEEERDAPASTSSSFESELRIPMISGNLAHVKAWGQTHMFSFSPEKSGQFIRICFQSQKHKTKAITQIGRIEIPLENIVAMIRPVNSRTATRRFRVNKCPHTKLPKEFQTWRKLNAAQQRRFAENCCYGDVSLRFRLTSSKETQAQAPPMLPNAIVEAESAVDMPIRDIGVELRHDFEPFRLGPMEVGKHVCAMCGKRMFNPKASNQRRCRYCKIAIHERCEAEMYDVACAERRDKLDQIQTEQENEERITRAMASTLDPSTAAASMAEVESPSPISTTSTITQSLSLFQLCQSLSDTTKMDKFAYIGKFLKREFRERNLTTNQEKYAYIQHEIEKIVEEDRKRQQAATNENGLGDPAHESVINDNLTILQLFGIHYNQ